MSREEAAAKAHYESGSYSERWSMAQPAMREFHLARMTDGIAAADAFDAANEVHRVSLDDATVERAARVIDREAWNEQAWMFVTHDQSVEEVRAYRQTVAKAQARAVLAAAVKED